MFFAHPLPIHPVGRPPVAAVPRCGTFPRHSRREGLALPPVFGIFSVNAGVSPFEAGAGVAAPYGCHCPWKTGGHIGPPLRRLQANHSRIGQAEGLALPPVSEFLRSTLGVRPAGRRAGSPRPTDVIVHGRRAATEGRPYGISGASQQNRTKREEDNKKDEAPHSWDSVLFHTYCVRLRSFIPCSYSRRRPAPPWTWGG